MPDQTQQPLTREELLAIIEQAARETITTDKCETNGRASTGLSVSFGVVRCNLPLTRSPYA
jgi:hypothetical protein